MASVTEHYEQHLGPIYTWMGGDLQAAIERNRAELQELGVKPSEHGVAIDLGAGPGGYTIPLAQAGYTTLALDTCALLVAELQERAAGLPIRALQADLLAFRQYGEGMAEVILCMGDTLTHLPSQEAVGHLLRDVAATLTPTGLFCATFRDYYTTELQGAARFIPVRSDSHRILTCFLEYVATHVNVYDVLQERTEAGWKMSVSDYPKLRLDPAWVVAELEAQGLTVRQDRAGNGMIRIVAQYGRE